MRVGARAPGAALSPLQRLTDGHVAQAFLQRLAARRGDFGRVVFLDLDDGVLRNPHLDHELLDYEFMQRRLRFSDLTQLAWRSSHSPNRQKSGVSGKTVERVYGRTTVTLNRVTMIRLGSSLAGRSVVQKPLQE